MAHIGLFALIASVVAFVLFTSRPRRPSERPSIPFSMTPPRVQLGEYFTFTFELASEPAVEHAYVQVVCYSALRTMLWRQHASGAFFGQRDVTAPASVQRLVFKGRFPSEAELWSNDIDPYASWIWRIEASARRGGSEWTHSFDVPGREKK